MSRDPAIIAITARGRGLAARLAGEISAEVIVPPAGSTAETLRSLFVANRPLIAVMAAGIVVRALAQCLTTKHDDPPVVVVGEDGAAIVPLLGGHHGANRLARRIAAVTGAHAAITTASDVTLAVALDEPPPGYSLANPADVAAFTARALAGEAVAVDGEADWLDQARFAHAPNAPLKVSVTDRAVIGSRHHLVYHPRNLVLGVGCERGASAQALIDHVDAVLAGADIAPQSIAAIASIDVKADEPALDALAAHLGVPARFFTAGELDKLGPRLATPSHYVKAAVGCPGVAEGSALAVAGDDARLIVAKTAGERVTCAVAQAPVPLVHPLPGRARGRLYVVGIGPGDPAHRTAAATTALKQASHWVGYGLYLDLIGDLVTSATRHAFPLGGEVDRVRHALALAGQGHDVALVCSGDAAIYAMAALVYETLDDSDLPDACRRVAIEIVPGVSALQMASARAGALIGHDFCAISLSDLLTPWPVIENRLAAAARGDFVVALYNPRSTRRTTQLPRAMAILAEHRPADTAVIVAANLSREDETVTVTTLATFDPATVDMMSIVLVGSSSSRLIARGDGSRRAYTPRGYRISEARAS